MPDFFVPGLPAPQGSKTRGRRGGVYETNRRVGPWRERVALETSRTVSTPRAGGVGLALRFVFQRPPSSVRKSGELRAGARPVPSIPPDVDKLSRAVLDALTGVLYRDDGQVVDLIASKQYGSAPGVHVSWWAV